MIPEDTYISCLTHRLIRTLDADHAVLAATIVDMCSHSEDGTMEISLEYLSTILDVKTRTLQRQLAKLKLLQVITLKSGDGRGNFCKFQKGDNFDAFSGIKGDKNDTLLEQERVTNFAKKGDKNDTLIYKEIIKAASAPAPERMHADEVAAADGELEKGSPQQKRKEKKNMEVQKQFDEWWGLFKASEEFQNRKESCERVWFMLSQARRDAFLKAAREGKKHRDNPLHYLQYDTPAEVKPEFPIFVNGDSSLEDAIRVAERGGRALAFVRAGEILHIREKFAHIYLADALQHKYMVIRTIPRSALAQVPAEQREPEPQV